MFCRVETGFKSEFSDPEAARIHRKIAEIHPTLAEKIRWIRKLSVVWLEFDTPRDKLVQAIQANFKNRVTDWVFTGDLLPSAAGSTGTLDDLMQESPFRPGIFHGIEKRKRLSVHDEAALAICDSIQTVLGRRMESDRVVTGELLLMEGVRLMQSDLEWVARNWFAHERYESWSLLSEEELKRNSRFQAEQVGKYLSAPSQGARSKLLQFRTPTRPQDLPVDWGRVEELLRAEVPSSAVTPGAFDGEEWSFNADIRFSSSTLHLESLNEAEFQLCRQQLDHFHSDGSMRLQTVLAVLPERNRLWRSEIEGEAPLKVREDFEAALERTAHSTNTPIAVMKIFEEQDESAPACFWTAGISFKEKKDLKRQPAAEGNLLDLFYIGHTDQSVIRNLIYFNSLQDAARQGMKGEAIEFMLQVSGRSLIEVLKSSKGGLQYGFDLVIDGISDWFKRFFESPMSLGMIWGVLPEKRSWLLGELKSRGVPFACIGSTSLTGEVRILEEGRVCVSAKAHEFFPARDPQNAVKLKKGLRDELLYEKVERKFPSHFKNRFSTEELILKPEPFHAKVASPVVIRPSLDSWSGLMALSDLAESGFDSTYLDYVLRKCTAMGGQIHSIQASFLNGLSSWSGVLRKVEQEYGIQVSELESIQNPAVQNHWLALQVVSKVSDVRMVRTEEFKFPNDRIYWLSGDFEQASTRWLAGFEGRYQSGLHSAVAIEATGDDPQGVKDALCFALKKRKLGAEIRLQHHFPGGFFVSVSENERFAVEEEWRTLEVEHEFVGRVTASPHLVIRNEADQVETLAIEDLL